MIHLDRVSKSFRRKGCVQRVLHQVNFTLPDVQGLALIGRNGAGKSTLLRLIAGTMRPDAGRVITDESVSWPMGFSGGFHPALSGAQNTRFVARIYGRNPREMADFVYSYSELGAAWQRPVGNYSQGMKARLAFAISMGVDFDTFLVDEIIGVGDQAFRKKCADTFRVRMNRSKVVMISHNPGTLRQFCQAGLVLEHGRLTYFPRLDDALAHHDANLTQPA